jgi:hypothetical protein
MARVFVSALLAWAVGVLLVAMLVGWRGAARTVPAHGVRRLVQNLGRALDGEAGPFLHGGTVEVLFGVLLASCECGAATVMVVALVVADIRQRPSMIWARRGGWQCA